MRLTIQTPKTKSKESMNDPAERVDKSWTNRDQHPCCSQYRPQLIHTSFTDVLAKNIQPIINYFDLGLGEL